MKKSLKKSSQHPDVATLGERRSLEGLVGKQTYGAWVEMLRRLVPDGRAHRLSVVVAGMLQCAAGIAYERCGAKPAKGTLAASLFAAVDWGDPDEVTRELSDVVVQLFKDARVPHARTDHRGNGYSIVDSAIDQYAHWHSMPWEEGWRG